MVLGAIACRAREPDLPHPPESLARGVLLDAWHWDEKQTPATLPADEVLNNSFTCSPPDYMKQAMLASFRRVHQRLKARAFTDSKHRDRQEMAELYLLAGDSVDRCKLKIPLVARRIRINFEAVDGPRKGLNAEDVWLFRLADGDWYFWEDDRPGKLPSDPD
jgi:hypothetical protein